MRDFVSIKEAGRVGILKLLDIAEIMLPYASEKIMYPMYIDGEKRAVPCVFGLFLERSLRTWGSFVTASEYLGFNCRAILGEEQTSLSKGETLANTIRMLTWQQGADILVLRTKHEGASKFASHIISKMGMNAPVINAGDGSNYHPSQTLLDLLSIKTKLKRLDGFTMGLCGDILHSRVAHGLLDAAKIFGFKIGIFSPPESRPPKYWSRGVDIAFESDLYEDLKQCDILYVFRLQKERISDPMDQRRVLSRFQITPAILDQHCRKNVLVMHAQPIDAEDGMIKIYPGIFRDKRFGFIQEQARFAVPARMAVLSLVYQGRNEPEFAEDISDLKPEVVRDESIESHFKALTERKAEIFKPTRLGTVIDHLPVNSGSIILALIEKMKPLEHPTVLAKRVSSKKLLGGKKDVLMLEGEFLSNEIMATIAMLCPQATFNIIREGRIMKMRMPLPSIIPSIFPCPNPICITNNDPEAETRFSVEEEDGKRNLVCRRCERVFETSEILNVL